MPKHGALAALVASLLVAGSAAAQPYTNGDVVVFFGDSITHGGRYHQYIADYYRTRFPESSIRFVNSGIGGDTAAGAYGRIPEDVAEYKPTHVTFHFGMNDIGRGHYLPEASTESIVGREEAQARYRVNLPKLIAAVREVAPNAKFTYLTPTPYEDTATVTNAPKTGWASYNNFGCNAGLSLMAGFVVASAGRDKADCVDWYSVLNNFRVRHQKEDPHFTIVRPDRVHPEELGHAIMAWEFLKRQGVPSVVSEVEIDAKGGKVTNAENGEVSGLKVEGIAADAASAGRTGVAFDLLAKALPFPVHEKARPYLKEFDVENTLNRETVRVTGLAAGVYALRIDGAEVGRYAAEELAKGVGLGFNEKTPQYRQAQEIAARHCELREREAVLRNHHSARWAFSGRAPVDDVAAFRDWYEKDLKAGGKRANSYFGKFIPGYLEYWPKYREVRAKLWEDQEAVRKLAKPVAHRYDIVKIER